MVRHGFVDRPARTVAEAAALTVGLQAQDLAQLRLGVRARAAVVTDADVSAAIDAERSVVRTWLMRNTIHLVPAADVRWLAALLGPMIRRRFENQRWQGLGLTPKVLDAAAAAAPSVLAAGPLTRQEFVAALRECGVLVDPNGQAPVHVLVFLATHGLVCHADGDRFALVDSWLSGTPAGPRGDDALAELARRFFRAFSPAVAADFTTWSGLPSGRAIGLIRDELVPVQIHGRPGFRLGDAAEHGGLRLLGGFDNYLIGYRDRAPIIDAGHRDEVYIGGIIRPTVLLDGRVIGRWRLDRPAAGTKPVRVEVVLFARPTRAVRAAIDAEVADLGRFLARETQLRL
jgi:hypothetical protein